MSSGWRDVTGSFSQPPPLEISSIFLHSSFYILERCTNAQELEFSKILLALPNKTVPTLEKRSR